MIFFYFWASLSTKCAGMGCDVPDIRLTVCVGLPKDSWELSQMMGRGGRDGHNAAFVIMLWAGQAGGRGQCKDLGRLLLERKVEQLSTASSKLTILTNTIHQKQWKRDAVILVSWRKCAFAQCANVAVTVQTSAGAATQMWALMNL